MKNLLLLCGILLFILSTVASAATGAEEISEDFDTGFPDDKLYIDKNDASETPQTMSAGTALVSIGTQGESWTRSNTG